MYFPLFLNGNNLIFIDKRLAINLPIYIKSNFRYLKIEFSIQEIKKGLLCERNNPLYYLRISGFSIQDSASMFHQPLVWHRMESGKYSHVSQKLASPTKYR